MEFIRHARQRIGLSQREFAVKVGVSFRTLQQLEKGRANPRLSTLRKVFSALGHTETLFADAIARSLESLEDSIEGVSRRITADRGGWKTGLFNFVDAFRSTADIALIEAPPIPQTPAPFRCLLASTVETLCDERSLCAPWWCAGSGILPKPFFVAGIENLKAMALVESPVHFRKRNIFVLDNFLARA